MLPGTVSACVATCELAKLELQPAAPFVDHSQDVNGAPPLQDTVIGLIACGVALLLRPCGAGEIVQPVGAPWPFAHVTAAVRAGVLEPAPLVATTE